MDKKDEKERKKAEVRARLEAQARKKKKGFMTPERKKRLRNLLRKKAAEELKKEQERKAGERKKAIIQRTGNPKPLDDKNEATLQAIIRDYHKRIMQLESEKYDVEMLVRFRDMEIKDLSDKVNNSRGKFDKPPLKKVSKMANQLEKIRLFAARASQANAVRASLKQVAKKEYTLDDKEDTKKLEKPEWAERSNKNIPRLSQSQSETVSGAASEFEEEDEEYVQLQQS